MYRILAFILVKTQPAYRLCTLTCFYNYVVVFEVVCMPQFFFVCFVRTIALTKYCLLLKIVNRNQWSVTSLARKRSLLVPSITFKAI